MTARALLPLAFLGLTSTAWGDQPAPLPSRASGLRLSYRPAREHGCPDEAWLRAAVTARLGYDPFAGDPLPEETLIAEVRSNRERLEGSIRWHGQERLLRATGPGCDELAAAMALALSIAVDPLAAAEPQPEAPPVAPPAPPPTPAVTSLVRTRVPPATATSWHLRAGALGAYGTAPGISPGLRAGLGIRRRSTSLDVEIEGRAPTSRPVATGHVDAGLALASVVPCLHRSRFAGCALVSAGVLRGRGHPMLEEPRTAHRAYAGVGGRISADVKLGDRLSLQLHADLQAALTRTALTVSGTEVWKQPPASVSAGVSLQVELR